MSNIIQNLTGKLLLAMPGMGDPRFSKAVIFICSHDGEGSMGLIINYPLPHLTLGQMFEQLNMTADATAPVSLPVLSGGPVEPSRGFMLHTSDFMQPDTISVLGKFGVSGTLDALKAAASGIGPKEMIFMLGYSGWGAGQLDQELQENAWMVTESDHELLFNTPLEDKWTRAMGRIGVNPSMLSSASGRA